MPCVGICLAFLCISSGPSNALIGCSAQQYTELVLHETTSGWTHYIMLPGLDCTLCLETPLNKNKKIDPND